MQLDKNNILVDIDGTVCEDISNENSNQFLGAYALDGAVKSVNTLYDQGNNITFFTSREEKDRSVTIQWLNRHNFKYHGLIMGKPRGGNYVWIDNLSVTGIKYSYANNWSNILQGFRKVIRK
mgnify:CR=1 FL=1